MPSPDTSLDLLDPPVAKRAAIPELDRAARIGVETFGRSRVGSAWLPLGAFLLAYLAPLAARPLAATDEVRYAEISRELIVSVDWVVPHLVGLPYFEKPPLGYWVGALSMELLGPGRFALRLGPALGAALGALAIGWLVRRHFRDARLGSIAARHPEPFWYFVPVVLHGGLPWAPLLPAAVGGHRRAAAAAGESRPAGRLTLFSLCWFLFPARFFSISSGKLATHVLPCFGPLVLFVVTGVAALEPWKAGRWLARCSSLLAPPLVLGALALTVLGVAWPPQGVECFGEAYGGGERLKAFGLALGLGGWAMALIAARRVQQDEPSQAGLALYTVGPLALLALTQLAVPAGGDREMPLAFLTGALADLSGGARLVADDRLVQPCAWVTERRDVQLLGWPGELASPLALPGNEARHAWSELPVPARSSERFGSRVGRYDPRVAPAARAALTAQGVVGSPKRGMWSESIPARRPRRVRGLPGGDAHRAAE